MSILEYALRSLIATLLYLQILQGGKKRLGYLFVGVLSLVYPCQSMLLCQPEAEVWSNFSANKLANGGGPAPEGEQNASI